ncbi:MAG: CsgG/HfaB family protein [Spirochaetaceae bacterium]|nr:CsgG/HfaB family protein [Spirochaetaceae bacterium]
MSLILLLLLSGVPAGVAHAQSGKVAVLGLENLNRDPRYDYLEGMIIGVLMYDLIRVDDIDLVERARLDRILEEQQLRLTGLLNDADTAKQVGQLAGADALIEGDYAFLGQEMIINLRVLRTADGTTIPISVRGYTENTVHNLAEQLVEELTGTPVIFAGIEGERSLLSLSDEEPGSIEFYCNFQQGEILVDEEFYGYTPGGTVPTLLEDLSPGEHTIRVDAGNNFGEIEWPQVIFKDWERTVAVKAGRKSVVRAEIYHYNDQLYRAMGLYRENWRLEPGVTDSIEVVEDLSFQDRSGRTVPVYFSMSASVQGERPVILMRIEADGESREWNVQGKEDEVEIEERVGIIEADIERDWYSNQYWSIDVSIWRRDIRQNLHHE